MYVCMYVRIYVCMYIYLRTYVCTYVCMYLRMYVCMYVCTYVYIHVHVFSFSILCELAKEVEGISLNSPRTEEYYKQAIEINENHTKVGVVI